MYKKNIKTEIKKLKKKTSDHSIRSLKFKLKSSIQIKHNV